MGTTSTSIKITHGSPRDIRVGLLCRSSRLDADHAVEERLVHGPLTALMLLDNTALQVPGMGFKVFAYRAVNPIPVNRVVSINGAQEDKGTIRVWAEVTEPESGRQVVGMVGEITLDCA